MVSNAKLLSALYKLTLFKNIFFKRGPDSVFYSSVILTGQAGDLPGTVTYSFVTGFHPIHCCSVLGTTGTGSP